MNAMKVQYEEKVELLITKIRETESERDKVLSGLSEYFIISVTIPRHKMVGERFWDVCLFICLSVHLN